MKTLNRHRVINCAQQTKICAYRTFHLYFWKIYTSNLGKYAKYKKITRLNQMLERSCSSNLFKKIFDDIQSELFILLV